ncbi:hypothetical protein BUALT_Bualt05G0123900 [Buddleja alternifolia]|uniref:Uncharacterized protein n=1 Tax=Buddleja alternifolia TaxID=168488 RepID=A0AAV6XRT9_9LAMI|nr:hypothetical protein BUALT_Bualt05G0123900 [Buddleja alternifolia]
MRSSETWLPFFIFLILTNISSTFVTAQNYYCLNNRNYTSNSTYNNNLNTIFSSLSSNMSNQGFHNASVGQIPDRVNAIALCRGDVQPDSCRSCIQNATIELQDLCPNQRQAILWRELCTLRYSDNSTNFIGDLADLPAVMSRNVYNATSPRQFDEDVRMLLDQLRDQAASGGSLMKVAAGNKTARDFQTIYGLLQCSPDISPDDCSRCLIRAAQRILDSRSTGNSRWVQAGDRASASAVWIFTTSCKKTQIKTNFTNRSLATGFGVVLIVITSIIILVMVIKRRKNIKNAYNHKNMEIFLKNHGNLTLQRYKYSQLKKMTKSFSDKLGKGGYGSVYKGKLHDGRLVAVKILNESGKNGEDFLNEVASITRTSHINIVTLLGFCFEGSKRALIYEFMPNGSLDKFLSEEGHLGWEKLSEIAVGIARGLEYLHRGCNMRILHLDIKPHNILLDKNFHPKIADFGLAKLCPDTASIVSMTRARGTVGYIAPEVFCRNFGEVSHKSDVYSYGMMVLEIVGERKNIDRGPGDSTNETYFPHWVYKHIEVNADEEDRDGVVEEDKKRKLTIVGLWCIQTDPKDRPSMRRVVEMLEGKLDSLQIPPNPYLSSSTRLEVDVSTYESSI